MERIKAVISPAELREQLGQSQIVVVDCRFALGDPDWGRSQYLQSHIPGAYYLDLNQDLAGPVQAHGGRHPLPDLAQFSQTLAEMGIGPETLVVAYDDFRFAFAARLWWLLRYGGHERVTVLDGGWLGWLAADYPTAAEVPERLSVGAIASNPLEFLQPNAVREAMVVDVTTVQDRKDLAEVVLIDSRAPERYRGEQEPIDPVAGHIPGAVNYFWQRVTDEQGWVRSEAELREHWSKLPEAEEILVYCGSGVTACVNLLALDLAGIHHGKLYPGSWSDWCSYGLESATE